jgi:hypothetical protein
MSAACLQCQLDRVVPLGPAGGHAAVLVAYGLVVKAVPVAGLVWPSGTMSA